MKSASPMEYNQEQHVTSDQEGQNRIVVQGVAIDLDALDFDLDPDEIDPSDFSWNSDNELVHEETGLIITEKQIDRSRDWRAFTKEEQDRKSRVGSPVTEKMHDKGLTTRIDWRDKDAYGRTISNKKTRQINRLRKWNKRSRSSDSDEKNLQLALSEISRMSSALGLPESVVEFSSVLYRRCLEEDLIRGRSIEGMATACIYVGCRQQGIPRSLDEVSDVSRVEQLEIGRAYRYISEELSLRMEPVDPKKYVPRFVSKLEVDGELEQTANKIIDMSKEEGIHSGKSPTGLAAAAIYTASLHCNIKLTQEQISEVANVTEVTIRNRYKEQIDILESF